MALYTENNDWQRFARERLQNSANNLQQKQAGLSAAQNQKTKTSLESALSGLVTGIGERIGDIGSTLNNIGKTVVGGINQIGQNKAIEDTTKKDSERRNEIAKKYGFNSYSEAANSGKVGDDFWNEIKSSNDQTKKAQKEVTDKYRNTGKYGDVTKVNTNMAKGQALNTIDSVLSVIPGVGGVVANVAGGAISGVGDEYKRAGREGNEFNWDNALKNAAVGGASGIAGSAGAAGLGKVATKFGGNAVGKALGSNLASGIAGGASAGAIGGALGTALNGGSLEDSLKAAWEGAKAGGIGGGAMAGTMGLGGTALEKLRNKKGATKTPTAVEPVEAQIVAKDRIEAPRQQRIAEVTETIEPVKSPRGIDIIDLDAGEQAIPVRSASTESRGRFIDSVVDRAKANLPEAKMPSTEQRFKNNFDKTLEDLIYGGDMGNNFRDIANNLKVGNITADDIARLKSETGSYAVDNNPLPEITKGNLPKLSIDDYMKVKGYTRREDIPQEMLQFLRKDGERFDIPDQSWGEMFPERTQGAGSGSVDITADDIIDYYENIASTPSQRALYTPENVAGALYMNPELNNRFQTALLDQYNPAQKIAVQGGPAISEQIPVFDTSADYRKATIPARTYETPTTRAEKVINAEPTATKPTPTTTAVAEPEIDYVTEVQRQKAQIAADKAKRQAIGGVIEQYGTTRLSDRIEGLPTAIEDMLDLGLTDRAEIELFSKKLASGDSEISKAIRKSLNDAAPIDGKWGFTWEDVFNAAGAANNEAAQKQIKSFYESQAKKLLRADENGQFNRNDVYDFGKALEKEGYKKYDRGVRNQNTNTQVYGEALINMSQDIIGKATDGVDVSGKFNTNKLKNLLPGNEAWANKVDALNANAKTVQDLRSAMASATKMNLLKQAEEYNMNTYGQNVGGKGRSNAAVKAAKSILTGKPLAAAEAGTELVLGSNKAKQKSIKTSYENYKKYQAQANGEAPVKSNSGKLGAIAGKAGNIAGGAKNIAGKAIGGVASVANKATTNLNNDMLANLVLGDSNSLGNQAAQFANKQMGKTEAERSEERLNNAQALANAQNEYNNAIGDYQAQEALYNNQMAQLQGNTGTASALDRIAKAMELAMNAGDLNAYSQLADLYTQAAKIAELQNPKKDEKALSATQSKALAGLQQLETLKGMQSGARTALADSPLGGLIDLTGGDEYSNQAKSLALTLGYLQSGANITPKEAEKIGKAYIPTAFDSEETRQGKLARAEQLLRDYLADTSALQA